MKIPDPHPSKLVKLHFVGMVVWALLAIPTVLWWKESILWVGLMSVYAAWIGHFGAWDAARGELAATNQGDTTNAD